VAYRDEVIIDAPNGYWRLDALTNESGGAGSLTAFGSPVSTTGLLTGDASVGRDLDGSTMYYTAPDSASTDLGDVFTLEAWIRIDGLQDGRLFDKGLNGYALMIDSTGHLRLDKSAISVIVTSTTTMAVGSTYHVAATKNGATVKLYINGVDVTGTVTNATCANTAIALYIGRLDSSATLFFNGVIDEPAIYPSALSATRVAVHYAVGSTGLAEGISLTSPVTITVAGTVTEQQLPEGPTVRVAFATAPGQPSLWTTVSAYQTGFSTRRGRQKELDLIDAGIASR
jgi:hypothetical protein